MSDIQKTLWAVQTLKNHQTQIRYYIYSFPKVEHNKRYCMSDANHGS